MALLNNKIKKWVDSGLISRQQADSILLFEKAQNVWQGGLIVFLGIIAVALGISAIIGANWEIIPDWLKLSADCTLLALLAWCGFMFYKQGRVLACEFVLFFYLLLILASIGLIGQVFHTGSPYYVALGLWCFMSLGLFLVSKRMPVPFVWLCGLGAATFGWLFDVMREIQVMMLLPYLGLAFALLSLVFSWLKIQSQARAAAIIFVLVMIAAALWSEFNGQRVFHSFYYDEPETLFDFRWGLALLIPCAALVWLAGFFTRPQKVALSVGMLWFVGLVFNIFLILSAYINHIFPLPHSWYDDIFIDPVASFTLLAWLGFYAVVSGHNRMFLLWLILAGVRICAIFLMAAYGLWQTGLALLVSGAVLVAIPLLWKKVFVPRLIRLTAKPALNAQEAGHE